MKNYTQEAISDAGDLIENFRDEIKEAIKNGKQVSDDWNNDYPDGDSYFHESYVDKSYGLLEAAEVLGELSDFEETDSGLWEGQSPQDAIGTQAAFTYGNAVWSYARDIVKDINDLVAEAEGEITDEKADAIINKALDNAGVKVS